MLHSMEPSIVLSSQLWSSNHSKSKYSGFKCVYGASDTGKTLDLGFAWPISRLRYNSSVVCHLFISHVGHVLLVSDVM